MSIETYISLVDKWQRTDFVTHSQELLSNGLITEKEFSERIKQTLKWQN